MNTTGVAKEGHMGLQIFVGGEGGPLTRKHGSLPQPCQPWKLMTSGSGRRG